jgi:ATP-dependent Clp protease ATP-binding subunit ClpA
MAMPGSILITPAVCRLAEGHIQVKSLGPVPIKGLHAPVEVYEVTGAGHVRTRLHAAAARGLRRFVGRDAELHTLHQALQQAGASHGQVVAAIGEAGVGKSRLVYECLHQLDPPQRRQRTLTALKRVLLRESQAQPLLLGPPGAGKSM